MVKSWHLGGKVQERVDEKTRVVCQGETGKGESMEVGKNVAVLCTVGKITQGRSLLFIKCSNLEEEREIRLALNVHQG